MSMVITPEVKKVLTGPEYPYLQPPLIQMAIYPFRPSSGDNHPFVQPPQAVSTLTISSP